MLIFIIINFTAKIRETQSLPNPHRNAGSRCRHSPLRLPESRRRLWNCSSWRHTSWVIKFLCFIVHVTFLYHVTLNVLELTFSSIFFFFFFSLPVPTLPPLSLVPNILIDSFVITMVSYTISMSMALIFAQKLSYEVDSNQELMAQVNIIISI